MPAGVEPGGRVIVLRIRQHVGTGFEFEAAGKELVDDDLLVEAVRLLVPALAVGRDLDDSDHAAGLDDAIELLDGGRASVAKVGGVVVIAHRDGEVEAEKVAYAAMSRALNASGRHMHFNYCGDSGKAWLWADEYMQSWRSGNDHTGTWGAPTGTKVIIETASAEIPAKFSGKPFGWNDMDMIQTGNDPQTTGPGTGGLVPNMTLTECALATSLAPCALRETRSNFF